jgi:peptidoglycan/xylan/chitin deacetylase (PgdA/CDA1 family)
VPSVALTFHGAGDPALCRRVLAEAAAADAHVTVLAVGTWLRQNPNLAGAIVDGGHDLGNHTWSHLPMRHLSSLQAHQEIRRGADLLVRLTGSRGRWFRPSGTPRSTPTIREAARSSGYSRCLAYDVDPFDYTDPGPDAVTARVLEAVRPGSIVSLHLGHAGTVAALPHVLDRLARRGLAAVTVSTLLGSAP